MPASLSLITDNFCSRDNSLHLDEDGDASESFRLRAEVDGFGGILSIPIIWVLLRGSSAAVESNNCLVATEVVQKTGCVISTG